jgi:N-acetylneuraminate synthase
MIKIGSKSISNNHKPFIIAELSGNHNQSLERAFALVEAAAKSGVDAIKIQTFKPDSMTLNLSEREFFIGDMKNPWSGSSLYDLYKEAYTPWEWHAPIFEKASELGLLAYSTPFDLDAIDFLESLNVPCYKIASFENTDLPLIRKAAKTGKPLMISTGLATIAQLDEAVRAARSAGCKDLIMLKCTSTYPATPKNTNILTIPHMRKLFNCEVGLSDHTMGIGVSIASTALGATVIEKHLTLKRSDGGVDSHFSMEPNEMRQIVLDSQQAWESLGAVIYGPTESEKKSIIFKRSLYITEDLKAGDLLTEKNIKAIRPGLGIEIKYLEIVLGRRIKTDVERGTALSWNLIA